MSEKPVKFRIKDDPAIPEIYANKVVNAFFDGHAVVVTFGTGRIVAAEHATERSEEGISVYVTCRIALAPSAAIELINSLSQILTAVQKAQTQKPAGESDKLLKG